MKKVFNILLIALILTILWILFLIINPNSSEIQGIKSVKTEYDNYYAEIDKKIEILSKDVTLIAVSKNVTCTEVRELYAQGQRNSAATL